MFPANWFKELPDTTTGAWNTYFTEGSNKFLIPHCPVTTCVLPLSGSNGNRTRYYKRVFAISNTWHNQRNLIRVIRHDRIFPQSAINTKFLTKALFIRSLYSILAILYRHWWSIPPGEKYFLYANYMSCNHTAELNASVHSAHELSVSTKHQLIVRCLTLGYMQVHLYHRTAIRSQKAIQVTLTVNKDWAPSIIKYWATTVQSCSSTLHTEDVNYKPNGAAVLVSQSSARCTYYADSNKHMRSSAKSRS